MFYLALYQNRYTKYIVSQGGNNIRDAVCDLLYDTSFSNYRYPMPDLGPMV